MSYLIEAFKALNALDEDVFSVSDDGIQRIVHEQEEPEYHKEYDIDIENPITAKVYVIDDGDHCTMLLAEEY